MKLSAEERASGQLSPESLESAVNQVKLNGFVVFEEMLSPELTDTLNTAFLEVLEEASNEATEVNSSFMRLNRIRMDLPFREPFIDPQVITNQFALPIIERLLGDDCRCCYFSVDAPMPGSDYQTVHGDYAPFFPESNITLPAAGIVVNFPTVDVTEENGPMEAWPGGTHLTPENLFTSDYVTSAAAHISPMKMLMPKGSMIIRDVRMWHRGTPNKSDSIRPNIALIYTRSWWDGHYYPQDSLGIAREKFEGLSDRAKKLFRFEKLVD